mmetsp:Transcript_24083/g.55881  ORF Transcript_24083/g.55881 Transcript_24083/m.55881 type:complete len:256 (-) Transcript_24083:102-869(-)
MVRWRRRRRRRWRWLRRRRRWPRRRRRWRWRVGRGKDRRFASDERSRIGGASSGELDLHGRRVDILQLESCHRVGVHRLPGEPHRLDLHVLNEVKEQLDARLPHLELHLGFEEGRLAPIAPMVVVLAGGDHICGPETAKRRRRRRRRRRHHCVAADLGGLGRRLLCLLRDLDPNSVIVQVIAPACIQLQFNRLATDSNDLAAEAVGNVSVRPLRRRTRCAADERDHNHRTCLPRAQRHICSVAVLELLGEHKCGA